MARISGLAQHSHISLDNKFDTSDIRQLRGFLAMKLPEESQEADPWETHRSMT